MPAIAAKDVSAQTSATSLTAIVSEQPTLHSPSSSSTTRYYSDGRVRPPREDEGGISAAELDRRLDVLVLESG